MNNFTTWLYDLQSLQPLTRKVNHIEWFRFHPSDTQNALFDAMVNEMKIFEWVDENWEKCEYMYILDDKQDVYKMRIIDKESYKHHLIRLDTFNFFTPTWYIHFFKILLNDFIETIPLLPVDGLEYLFRSKNDKLLYTYHYFKCRSIWFVGIRSHLNIVKRFIDPDADILNEIDDYILFHKNEIKNNCFEFDKHTKQEIISGHWRTSSEDIEKGNEILRKVIAYLEKTYPDNKIEDEMNK